MHQLHPGVKWSFRFGNYLFGAFLAVVVTLFLLPAISILSFLTQTALVVPIIFILIVLAWGEIASRLTYKYWRYELTDIGFKSERGIIWKRYTTIPYERIQNVDIHRGIIARLAGFSSVMIQTAGAHFSGGRRGGGTMSEGYLPGVSIESAEKIRDYLTKRISHQKVSRQGL